MNKLNDLLQELGVSKVRLAKYLGVSRQMVYKSLIDMTKNAVIPCQKYFDCILKFLIDETQAKVKLLSTKVGQTMSGDKRADYLKPFTLTTILKTQMLNLVEENEGVNIILKQSSRGINKDKFSAFVYGLYYIKQEEDRKRRRKSFNIQDFLFLN